MLKKLYVLPFLAILCISKAFSINKQALDYLEKLREKEYVALKELCLAGGVSEEDTEKIIQFSKDFRNTHAKKFFSQKNPNFFHDPKLAEFKMGNSNVLEEAKKILKEHGINPESISIRYEERYKDQKEPMLQEKYTFLLKMPNFVTDFLNKVHKKIFLPTIGTVAYVSFFKDSFFVTKKEVTLDNIMEKLNSTLFHQQLVITQHGVSENYSNFRITMHHEISHLLEGDVIINTLIPSRLWIQKKFSDLWNKFCYRQEVIADVKTYFASQKTDLLNALRKYHLFGDVGHVGPIHPTHSSTYKRLQKINNVTHKIPFYKYIYYESGHNALPVMIYPIGFIYWLLR